MATTVGTCPYNGQQAANTSSTPTLKTVNEIPGPKRVSFLQRRHDVKNYFNYLLELNETYGDIVKEEFAFSSKPVVHVFSPEYAEKVFRTDGNQPHIVPLQETTKNYRTMRGMNPGLGNLNGDEWYRLRSATSQILMKPQGMEKYVPFVEQVAHHLIDHIRYNQNSDNEVDMRKIAGRWSLESAGLIVFERRLGALNDNVEWADYLTGLNHEIFKLSADLKFALPIFRFLPTGKWRKLVELEDKFYAEAHVLMKRAISDIRNNKIKISQQMLVGELASQRTLTEEDVKIIMLSLFSDGLSTTAPMLIYNLYNLAKHPDIQDEIRKEVNSVSKNGEELVSAKRNKLPMLKASIKETFRLYPIGTEISRIPQKSVTLGEYVIDPFTPIDINTNILTRSAKLFTNPNEYQPSRWLRGGEKGDSAHPYALLPFGIGPRMCAGRRFAEQDLQIVLSRLIQNYKISYNYDGISQIYETLLLPNGNCHFKFEQI
ncbi:unnamed protein product [Auanema sp. JU1783]|nr:unnamed protein product [Auanema sp. JU1783]